MSYTPNVVWVVLKMQSILFKQSDWITQDACSNARCDWGLRPSPHVSWYLKNKTLMFSFEFWPPIQMTMFFGLWLLKIELFESALQSRSGWISKTSLLPIKWTMQVIKLQCLQAISTRFHINHLTWININTVLLQKLYIMSVRLDLHSVI